MLSKASGEKAEIVVDLEAIIGPMPTPWRNLAQGGEEAGNMLDNVVGETKALRPEYIRLDHIYDMYEVVSQDGGGLRYDWSRLDETVRSILEAGGQAFLGIVIYATGNIQGRYY